jgi:hypothetical protein
MFKRSFVHDLLPGRGRTRTGEMTIHSLLLIVLMVGTVVAQEPTFEAGVDRNPVGVGEQFTLSYTLVNAGMGGGKNLRLPELSHFHILAGPNQSSNMQFVNGAVSSSITYSYVLQPKEVGKFTIGPATIEAGSKKLESGSINIEVVRASGTPKQQARTPEEVAGQLADKILLKVLLDRTHVLQGEQINVTFKVYTLVSIVDFSLKKAPNYTGFWVEDLETPKGQNAEVVDGKRYRTGVIRKVALFPTQSGTLEISPMELTTVVQVQSPRSLDPFDAFFRDPFGRNVNYEVKSEAVKIKVDPLPGSAPAEFKGAVGQFAMSTSIDKKSARTNEAVDVKVTVSGTGNIKLLEAPAVEFPPDFEQYSPKVSDNISRSGDRITGSKTFEFLVLPRYPGLKVIKPITFSYFDLGKREYVRLRSPQLEVNVEQGAATPGPLIAGTTREDVKLLSEDIRFIKIGSPSFRRAGDRLWTNAAFLGLLFLPVLAVAGTFAYTRRKRANAQDEVGYRNRRAIRVAQKGLKQAEYLLKEKGAKGSPSTAQRARFYSEVSRALWKYLGDKLNIPQAEFSVERALTVLTGRSIDNGLLRSLRTLMETCDMARFAPTSMEIGAMQRTYDEAKRIIVELERTLK